MSITILIRAIQKTYMIINRIYNFVINKKFSCKKKKKRSADLWTKSFISKNWHIGKKHETNIKGFLNLNLTEIVFAFSISVRKCDNEWTVQE